MSEVLTITATQDLGWRQKKVLVTGAGGFIGSHLVERLVQEGAQVRALVHYNSRGHRGHLEGLPEVARHAEVIVGDLTDPFRVRKAVEGCEVVFHLGALIAIPYSYLAPQSYVQTNVTGTLHVLQACLDCRVQKMVHTSTSETYGTAIYTPIDEGHPLQAQSPYAASKIGADKLAESYWCTYRLPVATIRPFNTFGPRQSARAVIPTIISQILAGKRRIMLGALNPVRDFTFVKDTVEGFMLVAQAASTAGQVINVGQGKGITIGALAQQIITLLGQPVEIGSETDRIRPDSSEVMELICNSDKAKRMLGWQPRYSLEEGLKATVAFIEQNPHLYTPDLFQV